VKEKKMGLSWISSKLHPRWNRVITTCSPNPERETEQEVIRFERMLGKRPKDLMCNSKEGRIE
jgi:hypothetical protein